MGVIGLAIAVLATAAAQAEPDQHRLYGRVTTEDGAVVEGVLHWDRNGVDGFDVLDGRREIPLEHLKEAERLDPDFAEAQRRARSIVAFGTRITWDEDDQSDPPSTPSGIRFRYLRSVEPTGDRSALLTLTSGEEIRFQASSSELGRSMRPLSVVSRADSSAIPWGEIVRVDFTRPPAGSLPPAPPRLYGTVATWDDREFTGRVAWDRDETLEDDVLDGRDDGGDRELPFSEISAIDWESDRSARVTLRSGEETVLRGTNDVDRSNRGIEVSDAGFGRVIVPWGAFRSIRFHAPQSEGPAWPSGAPGRPLQGVVHASDGRALEGRIRFGADREYAWEMLRGWLGDVQVDVELGQVMTIARDGEDGVLVTLRDGRALALELGDVPEGAYRGWFVQADGRRARLVRWRDFDRVDFTW